MTDEPSSEPRLADADKGGVEVVSDLKPGSRHWKDILVRFTSDAQIRTPTSFVGFFDVVAARWHPSAHMNSEQIPFDQDAGFTASYMETLLMTEHGIEVLSKVPRTLQVLAG